MSLIKTITLALFTLVTVAASAQRNPVVKKITPYKPPKLMTLLSTYKDSAMVPVDEAGQIVGLPLRIVDDKKVFYTITSFQFMYRKNVVTEDEQSGKVTPTTTILSDRFKSTPLPANWLTAVREQIKKGELLYFFDIIVKDAQGRVMYAPDFKIKVM